MMKSPEKVNNTNHKQPNTKLAKIIFKNFSK